MDLVGRGRLGIEAPYATPCCVVSALALRGALFLRAAPLALRVRPLSADLALNRRRPREMCELVGSEPTRAGRCSRVQVRKFRASRRQRRALE